MEKIQTLTPSEIQFDFHPIRTSHLRSNTFRTMARIFSVCNHAIPLYQPRPGNGRNESQQETELQLQDGETECTKPEISLKEKHTMISENTERISLQHTECSLALSSLKDMSEGAMKERGNGEIDCRNGANFWISSSENKESGSDSILIRERVDENVEQLQVNSNNQSCEVFKAINSSLNKDMIIKVSEPSEINQVKSSSLKMNVTGVEIDMHQSATELICRNSANLLTSSPRNNESENDVSLINYPEHVDGKVEQLQVHTEVQSWKVSEATNSLSHKGMVNNFSQQDEIDQAKKFYLVKNVSGEEHDQQQQSTMELVCRNNPNNLTSSPENNGNGKDVILSNNLECVDRNVEHSHVDTDDQNCNVSEVINSSLDKDTINNFSEHYEVDQPKSFYLEKNVTGVEHHKRKDITNSVCRDNAICFTSSRENNEIRDDVILINNRKCIDGNMEQLQVDTEERSCKISEAINISLDKDVIKNFSELDEMDQANSLYLKKNVTRLEHYKQQYTREAEKLFSVEAAIDSSHCTTVNVEAKDDFFSWDDITNDLSFEDDVISKEKIGEDGFFDDLVNIEGINCSEQRNDYEKKMKSVCTDAVIDSSHILTTNEKAEEAAEIETKAREEKICDDLNIEDFTGSEHKRDYEKTEKLVCTNTPIDSSHHLTENQVVEEGEISGDDASHDLFSQDVSLEHSIRKVQVYDIDNLTAPAKTVTKTDRRYRAQDGTIKKDFNNMEADSHDPPSYLKISKENATDNQGTIPAEKAAGDSTKKKRGKLTDERKEKRKRAKRLKRAEMNRKQGVKRLKLQPVIMPKKVTYCRHYLHGRCQQGGECKFSHDTVPLTKSSPCCHFARHMCMKGDDCPFDHELSKYPCNNYTSTGFCSRADDCMFSHMVPEIQETLSTTLSVGPEVKISQPAISNLIKQANTINSIRQNMQPNLAKNELKHPTQAPKGMNLLLFQKSPLGGSPKVKQSNLCPDKVDFVEGDNLTNQNASSKFPQNEIFKKIPAKAPTKGINLISYSQVPSNRCNNIAENDTDKSKDGVKIGNMEKQSASPSKFQSLIQATTKGIATSLTPQKVNIFSFQKSDSGGPECKKQKLGEMPVLLGQQNSGKKALFSSPAHAAKYDLQVKKDHGNISSNSGSASSQNGTLKASLIMDFLSRNKAKQ